MRQLRTRLRHCASVCPPSRPTSILSGYSSLSAVAGQVSGWPVNDPLPDSLSVDHVLEKFCLSVVQLTTDALSSSSRVVLCSTERKSILRV